MNSCNVKFHSKLWLSLLMLSVAKFSSAYDQPYVAVSIEQGLSQATVNTVAQDHEGYIWIGTQDGLNRYDGYKIVQYHHNPNDPSSLSHSFINKVVVDKSGVIWILTAEGIDRFDADTASFTRYQDKKFSRSFFERLFLWSMQDGLDSTLWLATANGVLKFNKSTGKFRHYPRGEEFGLTAKNAYDISVKKSAPNIVVSDSGIFHQSETQDTFTSIPLKHLSQSSNEPRVYCISNVVANTYFMCAREGIYYFYKNKFHYLSNQELGLSAQSTKILITRKREILIGTVNGLHIKKLDLTNLTNALRETVDVSLVNNVINVLYEDKDSVIWVGSDIAGVYKILPTARAFTHFSADSKSSNRLANNFVTSISESESGQIWVGDSRGGISILDGDKNIRHLSLKDKLGKNLFHNILDIEFDHQQNAWIANALGVTKFSRGGEQLETIDLDDPSLTQQTYATQVFKSGDGRIWVTGLESGLNLYHPQQKRFVPIRPVNWPENKPFAKLSSVVFIDNDKLWFGGYQGVLYYYDLYTREARQFAIAEKNETNFAITQVYGIAKDNQNRLWVAGMGGIGFFDLESLLFTYVSRQKPLSPRTYYSVVLDGAGFVWTVTSDKVIRIDPTYKQFIAFDRSLGVPIVEFSPAAIYDKKGRIWLGGINGLTRFDPLKVISTHSNLQPKLTGLEKKSNSRISPEENVWIPVNFNLKQSLLLAPDTNTLRFSFSVLDFSQNSSVRYRYRLDGYDNAWNLTKPGMPEAIYTKIPYGDYKLEVATSVDGVKWVEALVLSQFTIKPYFWQALWFKMALIGLSFLAIYFIAKLNTQRIKNRALQLERLVAHRTDEISRLLEQRTRFFAFISHELKTPLTLVQDPLNRLQKNIQGSDSENRILLSTASRNANRLSMLVDRLLKSSTEETVHRRDRLSFNHFVKNCTNQLAEFALSSRVTLVTQRSEACYLTCNSSDVEIIVLNLLSNAIKYNRVDGKAFIRCYPCNGLIVFSVSDQGQGFANAKVNEQRNLSLVSGGYGLSLASQSAALLKGKIRVKNRGHMGSTVCAIFPSTQNQTLVPVAELKSDLDVGRDPDEDPDEKSGKKQPTIAYPKARKNMSFGDKKYGAEAAEQKKTELPEADKLITESSFQMADVPENRAILMIVEDNQELREYLCDFFSDCYHCVGLADAENALSVAVDITPSIIISDLVLPGISGITFCQQLKKDLQTCHIPVLLLTAKSDQETRICSLKHQATDFLTKPFNSEELKLRVANLLELTRRIYENNQSVSLHNLYVDDSNTPPGLGDKDKQFMRRFVETLASNYTNSDYNLEKLCLDLYMSKKQLSRKLKAISGKSPMEYLKEYRLQQAVKFLVKGNALSSVAIESGFSSQSYFSTCFKSHFGETPKQFQTKVINHNRESQDDHVML